MPRGKDLLVVIMAVTQQRFLGQSPIVRSKKEDEGKGGDEDVVDDEDDQPARTGYVKQKFTVPEESPLAYTSSTFPRFPKSEFPSNSLSHEYLGADSPQPPSNLTTKFSPTPTRTAANPTRPPPGKTSPHPRLGQILQRCSSTKCLFLTHANLG